MRAPIGRSPPEGTLKGTSAVGPWGTALGRWDSPRLAHTSASRGRLAHTETD